MTKKVYNKFYLPQECTLYQEIITKKDGEGRIGIGRICSISRFPTCCGAVVLHNFHSSIEAYFGVITDELIEQMEYSFNDRFTSVGGSVIAIDNMKYRELFQENNHWRELGSFTNPIHNSNLTYWELSIK